MVSGFLKDLKGIIRSTGALASILASWLRVKGKKKYFSKSSFLILLKINSILLLYLACKLAIIIIIITIIFTVIDNSQKRFI